MLFKLTDATKSYGGQEILREVSFQVNPGEKVGLVGRNGAGKSTLFRLISGEEQPDSGTVESSSRLKLGLLEQHIDFDAGDTVHDAALAAFKSLLEMESEMRRLEHEMAENASPDTLERYAELQSRFEHDGGFECTARAESVLTGLNFPREMWKMDTAHLSGGQKNRLGLVRLLLSDADVLLLDEPTNHLDVETVEWLEAYLAVYPGSYVIISHDRYFLDKTCTKIVELENGFAYTYSGNYSKYAVDSEIQKEQRQREYENQRAFINKTEAFIRKNLAGQKTKQAKSRRNMLSRMERKEAVVDDKKSSNFDLASVERTGANVLSVKNLSIGYPGTVLAENLEFTLHRGDCLGVIGGNGTGKSTFLKTVLGDLRELSGEIVWGTKVRTGYYSQQLDDLNLQNDVISELRRVAPDAENGQLRSFLAGFLFFGDDVFKRVADLSGGEKGRLALGKLIYSKANVLVLDEPTNHLDIASREALESALEAFEGTIIAVSHDRFFLDRVATQILSFEPRGGVEIYNGNYSQFHDWKEGRRAAQNETRVPRTEKRVEAAVTEPSSGKYSKNELNRMKARADELESLIPEKERILRQLAEELSNPSTATDPCKINEVAAKIDTNQKEIESLYAEWESILEKLN